MSKKISILSSKPVPQKTGAEFQRKFKSLKLNPTPSYGYILGSGETLSIRPTFDQALDPLVYTTWHTPIATWQNQLNQCQQTWKSHSPDCGRCDIEDLTASKAVVSPESTALQHKRDLFESDTKQPKNKCARCSYRRPPCKEYAGCRMPEGKGVLANRTSREKKPAGGFASCTLFPSSLHKLSRAPSWKTSRRTQRRWITTCDLLYNHASAPPKDPAFKMLKPIKVCHSVLEFWFSGTQNFENGQFQFNFILA